MSETRTEYKITEPRQPGPELDILVAKVMGWRLSDRGFYVKGAGQPESYDTPDNWKPSTKPAAAMEAWEWLVNQGFRPQLKSDTHEHLVTANYYGHIKTVIGKEVSHAIALAVCEAGRVLGVIE